MNRRELLTRAGLGASAGLASVLAPIKALGAEVKPIRIKNVETFNIEIPATPTEVEAGVTNRTVVVRVETESGIRGYSFGPRRRRRRAWSSGYGLPCRSRGVGWSRPVRDGATPQTRLD